MSWTFETRLKTARKDAILRPCQQENERGRAGVAMPQADVVIVPDFGGVARRVFEVRTLLFLGSWLEHTGASREWPLHLACVGEPPASVVALAERCGARISLHEKLSSRRARTLNKMRGLEVTPAADRLLLLDVDIVILGDLSPLLDLGLSLGALPEYKNRVPYAMWERLYPLVGLPLETERIQCLRGRLADKLPDGHNRPEELQPMPPYYNSGVLLVPWTAAADLRRLWQEYIEKIHDEFLGKPDDSMALTGSDEAGLAMVFSVLKRKGVPFKELPDALHGNRWLYCAGTLSYAETRLFHTVKFLRMGGDEKTLATPGEVYSEVDLYEQHLLKALYPNTLTGKTQRFLRRLTGGEPPQGQSIRQLCARLRELIQRYVFP